MWMSSRTASIGSPGAIREASQGERQRECMFSGSIRLHLTFPSRADLNPKVNEFARILARHLKTAATGR
jgi:hypothetical protein